MAKLTEQEKQGVFIRVSRMFLHLMEEIGKHNNCFITLTGRINVADKVIIKEVNSVEIQAYAESIWKMCIDEGSGAR